MTEHPKYYWLKLPEDFFRDLNVRILRETCGDAAVIIYINMLLKAMSNGGVIEFKGYFENFYEELAFILYEDKEVVKKVLETLTKQGLLETEDGKSYFLPAAVEYTGSESASAERMRKKRKNETEQKKNSSVTKLHNVQKCAHIVPQCDTEKEIEIEKELEIESETEEERALPDSAINLRLQNGEDYLVSSSEIKKWKELYPNVNIEQELRIIKGWLESNPDKRKRKQNMPGYINAWLTRKQENPPAAAVQNGYTEAKQKKKEYVPDPRASYDIEAAELKMMTSVPTLPPKKKKSPS